MQLTNQKTYILNSTEEFNNQSLRITRDVFLNLTKLRLWGSFILKDLTGHSGFIDFVTLCYAKVKLDVQCHSLQPRGQR